MSRAKQVLRIHWFFCVLMIIALSLYGVKPIQAQQRATNVEHKKKIETLIEKLASRNKQPVINAQDDREIEIPRGYSVDAQKDILVAWKELLAFGDEAVPPLVAHLADNRYSYTEKSGPGTYYNRSVGDACTTILGNLINVYGRLTRPEFTGNPPEFFPDSFYGGKKSAKAIELKRWFDKRHDKILWELQVEAARWAVVYEKKRGLGDDEDMPFGRMILGTRGELDRSLFGLELLIRLLEATKTPIIPEPDFPETVIGVDRPATPDKDHEEMKKHERSISPAKPSPDYPLKIYPITEPNGRKHP